MHPDNIAFQVFRTTLVSNTSITELVSDRVIHRDAPEGVNFPYIVGSRYSGGELDITHNRDYDAYWKIVGISTNRTTSKKLQDAIFDSLHRKLPDTSDFNPENLKAYSWVVEQSGFRDSAYAQNIEIFYAGGIYRIRLAPGDI